MELEVNLSLDRCPHCSVNIPNLPTKWGGKTYNHSGSNPRNWKVYECQNCGGLILAVSPTNTAQITSIFPDKIQENFEFEYLKGDVAEDFHEALKCYSNNCFNAFAAMCRRTIQSIAKDLGADGKDKVKNQILELKSILNIDNDTYSIFEQIILAGHDGAHPHLLKLSSDRVTVLLELMKDVIYQLYIRKIKIEESVRLRNEAIDKSKHNK